VATVPRSFDISADSPAGAGQVHSAFSDEGYWLARFADSGDEVGVAVPGAPISLAGKVLLTTVPTGSRVRFSGTVDVKVPLVGGRIEGIIGDGLSNLVVEEQRFTATWIAENT
jgi:uncharacterized protein DUF2505